MDGNRKKILFVEQTQDGTIGGSHYCLLYLAQLMDRMRFEPLVLFYEEHVLLEDFKRSTAKVMVYKKPRGRDLSSRVKGVTALYVPLRLVQKLYNWVNASVIPTFRFIHIILKEHIDVVHLNNAVTGGSEWIVAARLTGRPCLTFQRGYHDTLTRTQRFMANRFDGIYCVSNVIRNNLIDNRISSSRCVTLYDGIDPERLVRKITRLPSAVRDEFRVEDNAPFIGMVGNFMPWKGQDILVRAMALLKTKYPHIKCLLVGSVGSDTPNRAYFDEVMEFVGAHGLESNVAATGYRSDVADLINALDIQVHPPTAPDPFPHVILEGMTLGKAIVASNIGGAVESIEDRKSGILAPPSDPQRLSELISLLIDDKELRAELGQNARTRVTEKFHIALNVQNVQDLYSRG